MQQRRFSNAEIPLSFLASNINGFPNRRPRIYKGLFVLLCLEISNFGLRDPTFPASNSLVPQAETPVERLYENRAGCALI
jgi:hypothetical protein